MNINLVLVNSKKETVNTRKVAEKQKRKGGYQ